jgi:hypothetical protein
MNSWAFGEKKRVSDRFGGPSAPRDRAGGPPGTDRSDDYRSNVKEWLSLVAGKA